MQPKPFSCIVMIAAMAIINISLYAQCRIPYPPDGQHVCEDPFLVPAFENNDNTIVVSNLTLTPPSGSYLVSLSYWDVLTGDCSLVYYCQASLSSSGSSLTISLGNCITLPELFSYSPEIVISMQSPSGAGNYYLPYQNGGCIVPFFNSPQNQPPAQVVEGIKTIDLLLQDVSEQNALRFNMKPASGWTNLLKPLAKR